VNISGGDPSPLLNSSPSAPSTPKKPKSANLSKRILAASKVRQPRRSHLRPAWPRPPCDRDLRCRLRPQLLPQRFPIQRLPRMLRPINLHSPGPRLLLGLLRFPAASLLAPLLLGRTLPPLSTAAVHQGCSDPNPQMRRKNVLNNINVGFPLLPLPISWPKLGRRPWPPPSGVRLRLSPVYPPIDMELQSLARVSSQSFPALFIWTPLFG